MNIKGWVAIVTGGASGIGRQTALRLAREGAKVALVDKNLEGANKVAAEIKSLGGETLTLETDITNLDEAHRMAKAVLDKFGHVDILANIAGEEAAGPRLLAGPPESSLPSKRHSADCRHASVNSPWRAVRRLGLDERLQRARRRAGVLCFPE